MQTETVRTKKPSNIPSVTAGGDDGSGGRKPKKKLIALSECLCESADELQTGQVLFCPVHSALVTRVSDSLNLPSHSRVAQLVVHHALNVTVVGSSPTS